MLHVWSKAKDNGMSSRSAVDQRPFQVFRTSGEQQTLSHQRIIVSFSVPAKRIEWYTTPYSVPHVGESNEDSPLRETS